MDVSVIILNYKSARLVKYCLRSLFRALPKASLEIIVVDNPSKEDLEPIEKTLVSSPVPAQLIRSPRNGGYAAGNNLGIMAARGRYVLIANPDIVFQAGTIDRLVEYLDTHPKAAIAAPALRNPDGTPQPSCFRFHSWRIPLYRRTPLGRLKWAQPELKHFEMADTPVVQPTDVDWIMGSCVMVRRAAMDQVGLLDEDFFMYFEDTDWCRRFHNAGWEVVCVPDAEVIHYYSRASAGSHGLSALFSPLARVHIKSAFHYFYKYAHAHGHKI